MRAKKDGKDFSRLEIRVAEKRFPLSRRITCLIILNLYESAKCLQQAQKINGGRKIFS